MKRIAFKWKYVIVFIILVSSFSYAQSIDSLTIELAIQQVINNHPLIKQAGQQVRASQARISQSSSFYYPQLEAVGTYSRIGPVPTLSIPDMGTFSLYPENNYDFHLGARHTVFDFGRRSKQSALAQAQRHLAEDHSEKIKSALAYQTARTFYTILFLQENIRLLDEEIFALNSHLSIAEKKLQTGSATDFDVLTIRVRVANARSEKVDVESILQKQTIILKTLMGLPPDQDILLKGTFILPDEKVNADSLLSRALSRRPEITLASDAVTSRMIQTQLESLGNKPALLANMGVGVKNGYIPDLNQAKFNWVAGVQVQIPLFDGFRTRYRTEESYAELEAAKAHRIDVIQQIRSEIDQALADIKSKKEKITTSELQLEQAERALTLAKTQYEIGVITNLDLLIAQTARHEANLQHVKALYQMILSRFTLQETVGNKIW